MTTFKTRPSVRPLPLEQTQPGLFTSDIPDLETLLLSSDLFLLAGGTVERVNLADDLPRYLVVGLMELIAKTSMKAYPGVPSRLESPPPGLAPGPDEVCIGIGTDELQAMVKELGGDVLCIYQPISPDRVTLRLVAVERPVEIPFVSGLPAPEDYLERRREADRDRDDD